MSVKRRVSIQKQKIHSSCTGFQVRKLKTDFATNNSKSSVIANWHLVCKDLKRIIVKLQVSYWLWTGKCVRRMLLSSWGGEVDDQSLTSADVVIDHRRSCITQTAQGDICFR